MGEYSLECKIDLVLCIDAGAHMSKTLDVLKRDLLKMCDYMYNYFVWRGKKIGSFRVKVIAFRDYLSDGNMAMQISPFYEYPKKAEALQNCINNINPYGGEGEHTNALEAMGYAIHSPWQDGTYYKRHIIIMFSDKTPYEPYYSKSAPNYPAGMAKSFDELSARWGNYRGDAGYMNQSAKRMLMFAPDESYWNQISDKWDNVLHYLGTIYDISELELEMVLDSLLDWEL